MRVLIRPTLLMIAQLGLFLAVVAWVVSQWWQMEVNGSWMGCGVWAVVVREGIAFRPPLGTDAWKVRVGRYAKADMSSEYFSGPQRTRIVPQRRDIVTLETVPGILLGLRPSTVSIGGTVRHWFLVTLFATLNIILHFIFHKRAEVQPCEV